MSDSIRQTLISCEVKAGDIGLVTQIFDDLLAVAEAADNAITEWRVGHVYDPWLDPKMQELRDALNALKIVKIA